MSPLGGHIQCVCGSVSITLHTPVRGPLARFRLECGCCDCRQALQWGQLQGGPQAPLLPDLWYFENDFTVESGWENVKLFKLRDNGMSIRFVATCCYSTLLVHHPGYQNAIVMVMSQGVKLNVPSVEKRMRCQMKDFPKNKIGELEPFLGNPVNVENLDEYGKHATPEEAFGEFMELL